MRDRRWIVPAEDVHSTALGHNTDFAEEETLLAETVLQAKGLADWLAVMEAGAYPGGMPILLDVRTLAHPGSLFEEASVAFVEVARQCGS